MSGYGDLYNERMDEIRQSKRERRKTKEDKIEALLGVDSKAKMDIVLRCLLEKMTEEQLESLCCEYIDKYI